MPHLRIVIVDDLAVVRKVLREALASDPAMEIVGIAGDGETALARAWQMPELVVEAIEFHHDVGNSPRENPLVEIVHIVDLLCRMRGIGYGYEEWRAIELAGLGPASSVLPAPCHHGPDSIHL